MHEFNDMLTPVLQKNSRESKEGYIMADFKINLMNCETDNPTSQFPDNFRRNIFFPHINNPTCHTSRYKTLIDNVLHNGINGNTVSGNVTTDISDHLAQFLITSYQAHSETKPKKILTRTFKSFVQENFKHDLQNVDWKYTLDIHFHDANHSFEEFFEKHQRDIRKACILEVYVKEAK